MSLFVSALRRRYEAEKLTDEQIDALLSAGVISEEEKAEITAASGEGG